MGEYVKKIGMRRILIMLLGNVFLGMGVSIFKFAGLGNDAYNAMMMALSANTLSLISRTLTSFTLLLSLS